MSAEKASVHYADVYQSGSQEVASGSYVSSHNKRISSTTNLESREINLPPYYSWLDMYFKMYSKYLRNLTAEFSSVYGSDAIPLVDQFEEVAANFAEGILSDQLHSSNPSYREVATDFFHLITNDTYTMDEFSRIVIANTDPRDEEPKKSEPMLERLRWTVSNPENRKEIAEEELTKRTDRIRSKKLDQYHNRGLDFLTQIRLIHAQHLRSNEHIVLSSGQARRVIQDQRKIKNGRLAGTLRDIENMNLNITLAEGKALCSGFNKVASQMKALNDQIETLFPIGEINEKITEANIYKYASAVQLLVALIHPFYEGNGRTSEDAMYILFKRRPDLAHLTRYISSDGSRTGDQVESRMELIDDLALRIVKALALNHGIPKEKAEKIESYNDFMNLELQYLGVSPSTIEMGYLLDYNTLIDGLISKLSDEEQLGTIPNIDKLAENLKNASPTYTFQDGTKI